MAVQELISRFPEIPSDLRDEQMLANFAETFERLLQVAHKQSPCSPKLDAGNHYYLKLIDSIDIYRYGLSTREKILSQIQNLLDQYDANPDGFFASPLPTDTAPDEVKGPGCT